MNPAFQASKEQALALFSRAPVIHLAAIDRTGLPILRTVHGVVAHGRIAFHGGDQGEKIDMLGGPVMASAEEIVAEIPSYFIDPERACPATTFYRSAVAQGHLRRVDDLDDKAAIMQAFMERYQPEGGHVPITASDPRYRKALGALLVAELVPERLDAKWKLGQNRSPGQIQAIMTGLWQRGEPRDLPAIRIIHEAHPDRPLPAFLRGPDSIVLCCAPDADDAPMAAALLVDQYWTQGVARSVIEKAQLGASAWVVARLGSRLVGTARATSDGARHAFIFDVAVHPEVRGKGVGKALMTLLLDHPVLRRCQIVRLNTRDAQGFYASHGFAETTRSFAEMTLRR